GRPPRPRRAGGQRHPVLAPRRLGGDRALGARAGSALPGRGRHPGRAARLPPVHGPVRGDAGRLGPAANRRPAHHASRRPPARALVVGVVAQTVDDGDFLAPIQQTSAARDWTLLGVPTRGLPRPGSPYSGLVVVADNLADVHAVRAEIAGLGYATSAPEHLVAS